jgi:selenocysteine lyase/cysteine desulfurase
MNASVGLLLELGIERIAAHLRTLHAPLLDWAGRVGAKVVSPAAERGCGILCLAPENVGAAFRSLKAARVICSLREGAIRLSPHAYNTVQEMERVVEILEECP